MLKKGDKFTNFCGMSGGNKVCADDYRGKRIAIFFYPRDKSPGCTSQACNLRDNITALTENNIAVIGISMDSEESHSSFAEKHALPYPLIADTDGSIATDFGVKSNTLLLKHFIKVKRITFLIDEEGIVFDVIKSPNLNNHAQEIVELFKK